MTEDEKRINNIESRVGNLETKFEMFMQEMRDFKTEMRQQNQMRTEDIREIRASINNIQNRIEDMGKHVRNLTVAAMVGMGTMTIAGLAIAISILLK